MRMCFHASRSLLITQREGKIGMYSPAACKKAAILSEDESAGSYPL